MKPNNRNNGNNRPKNVQVNKKKSGRSILPIIEEAQMALPPTLEILPDNSDNDPTLIDRKSYGATFKVEDGHVYTLRLGIHTYSDGLAAFRDDCAVACHIPFTPNKEQRIIGLFFVPEIYPVKYMDTITLRATKPFMLRYLLGSAVLESNNNTFRLPLGNATIITEKDATIVLENNLRNQIHNCHRLYFDALRVQVEVAFTK